MTGREGTRTRLAALTGATGFVGSHIAELLAAAGWRVRASVRPTSDLAWVRDRGYELVEAPLAPRDDDERARLASFVEGADAVIHCAGVVRAADLDGYRRGNVETTRALLGASRDAGTVRSFVYVSSLAASGPAAVGRPRREDDPCEPINDYGRSKAEAEAVVAGDWPFRTAVLRPPALYGPRDVAFVPLFQAARWGLTVKIGDVEELSIVDGRDVAAAAVLLAEHDEAAGLYFVDDGATYTYDDLADAVGRAWNRRVVSLPLPSRVLRWAARLVGETRARHMPLLVEDRLRDVEQEAWTCDGSRLRDELGFRAGRDLRRGFAETLAWLREGDRV